MTEITIKLDTISLDIKGYYNKGYPELHSYPNGDPGYPGEPPSFDIEIIEFYGKDITDLINDLNEIFCSIMKKHNNNSYYDLWIYLEDKILKELNK